MVVARKAMVNALVKAGDVHFLKKKKQVNVSLPGTRIPVIKTFAENQQNGPPPAGRRISKVGLQHSASAVEYCARPIRLERLRSLDHTDSLK